MTDTVEFWSGDFGSEYTKRNRVRWEARVPFWRRITESTGATSFLDVGCNAGWNMLALRALNDQWLMTGIDVNGPAVEEALKSGFDVEKFSATKISELFDPGSAQMVITSGVLIHVAPADLQQVMREIVAVSSQYVIAIEYEAPVETEVEYRGHSGKLWKRPYGALYEAMGLSLVEFGPAEGFDACTYWLMEKA